MIKNSVIVIPNITNEKEVCDYLLQTATILRQNNDVYIIDYFSTPRIIPFRRFYLIDRLNRHLYLIFLQIFLRLKHFQSKKFYFWLFFPNLFLISKIKLPGWQLVFDIVDYHFSPEKKKQELLERQKDELFKRADYVFSISRTLKKLYQQRSSKEIKLVPQGFAVNAFEFGKASQLKLPKTKPIIGFIGQISQRLDLDLLSVLIDKNPQWNFVFIGPLHHEPNVALSLNEEKQMRIMDFKNVHYYPAQKRETLPKIIEQFALCMIPYDVSYKFNRYCYPMKLFEYFYLGKPVISTPIEELKHFKDLVMIGEDAGSWEKQIKILLSSKWPTDKILRQRQLAINNSWQNKLEKISTYL